MLIHLSITYAYILYSFSCSLSIVIELTRILPLSPSVYYLPSLYSPIPHPSPSLPLPSHLPHCPHTLTFLVDCAPNEFPCSNGLCLPNSYKCDGDRDCPGGEDENLCSPGNALFNIGIWNGRKLLLRWNNQVWWLHFRPSWDNYK